ncbi:hypothetical protein [Nocardioides terrisoli]|uniref:hypothetical protein n=1 Tax=Nocardioides terrisoli TaxID=3388267 RepID=UPI00287B5C56|nr:hypothetical protein [Nocardioides marmorisolisilvae]
MNNGRRRGTARTTTRKALIGAGLAGAMVAAGVVVTQAAADSPPQRVLQSVNVDLGTDGTLYGITGVDVAKVDGSEPTTKDATYDPSKTASQLPVRVLTSYHAGDRTGTNLADLKDYKGPVRIDVTVQNTTMRPERLTYDVNGASQHAYALVGVPMTVVASANLGKDNVGKIVTHSDDGGQVTNGVLSQDRSGNAQVQWAALLAPPQLAPSTTFTLVENATKFQMPDLDISVQPGLSADTSIRSLMQAAFSEDGSSQLKLETQTINLVGQVTQVLAAAGHQLGEVQRQLHYSAGTLGSRTIGDLTSGTQTVASSTKALAGQLKALQTSLGDALKGTQQTAVSQLQASVDKVGKLLGNTSAQPATARLSGPGCAARVQATKGDHTVYGQLNRMISLLKGLSGATGGCSGAIQAALLKTVGTVDARGNAVCPTGSTSAICAINGAASKLDGLVSGLGTNLTTAQTTLTGLPVADAVSVLTDLGTAVTTLQTDAKAALDKKNQTNGKSNLFFVEMQLDNQLTALQGLISGSPLQASTLGQHGDLMTALDAIKTTAQANASAIGTAGTTGKATSQDEVTALQQQVCALAAEQDANGDPLVDYDKDIKPLLQLTNGHACNAADPAPGGPNDFGGKSLADQFTAQAAAWSGIATKVDTAETAVSDLSTKLQDVHDRLDTLIGDLDSSGSNVGGSLKGILDTINGLYDPVSIDCSTDPSRLTDDLAKAIASVKQIQCQTNGVNTKLSTDFSGFEKNVQTYQSDVHKQLAVVNDQRVYSDDQISRLFAAASGGLDTAAGTIRAEGKASVDRQNARLKKESVAFAKTLQSSVTGALKQIDSSVNASNRDLASSEKLLRGDLRNVLADLGSRTRAGSGLLGIMQAQAAQTRTSAARLGQAGAQASQFGNVRGADLGGIFLQQAQLQRALALQAKLPAFATTLPAGSQHVTVFSFHMRGVQ